MRHPPGFPQVLESSGADWLRRPLSRLAVPGGSPPPSPPTRCGAPRLRGPGLPPPLAFLPPLPPMLGSGKVAKCHRGHCSNKSSLVQHLQAGGGPSRLTPPPAPLTKHLLSWPSEDASVPLKRPRKPRRGPPGEARAPGGGPGVALSSSLVHTFPLSWGSPKAFHSGFIVT